MGFTSEGDAYSNIDKLYENKDIVSSLKDEIDTVRQ